VNESRAITLSRRSHAPRVVIQADGFDVAFRTEDLWPIQRTGGWFHFCVSSNFIWRARSESRGGAVAGIALGVDAVGLVSNLNIGTMYSLTPCAETCILGGVAR